MAILDPLKLGLTPCICGRISTKIHCPVCGSYKIRALVKTKSKRVDRLTGCTLEYNTYRCTRCGRSFDDIDWQYECKAPVHESKAQALDKALHTSDPHEIAGNIKALPLGDKPLNDEQMDFLMQRAKRIKAEQDAKKELERKAQEMKNE